MQSHRSSRHSQAQCFYSYEFIFAFLPLTLLGLILLGHWGKHRAAIVLARSGIAAFYGWWNPPYLALFIVSIVLNLLLGGWLVKSLQGESGPRRLFLAIGIAANLGSIGYFKYANFFVDNLTVVGGTDYHLATIILLLAISFFTFPKNTFLIDAYRGLVLPP